MSKPAAMPVFGDAYLADTTHLTTEEHGAYFLLLLAAWRQDDCALPNDERKLARISGLSLRKWKVIAPTIMEFWTVEDGRIFQGRQRREHTYVLQKSASNRKSAEARWSKQGTENIEGTPMRSHSERNAPPPPPIEEEDSVDTDVSTEPAGSKIPPAPPTAEQVKKAIFDSGKALLTAAGVKDPGALIVRWRRTYPDHVMLDVLTRCAGVGPEEPVPWITATLQSTLNERWSNRNGNTPRHDEERFSNNLVAVAAEREAARAAEEWGQPGDWSEVG